jgi:predicted methyltransferase
MRPIRYILSLFFVVLFLGQSAVAFQNTHPLTGRTIAGVMSAAGAAWLDRPEREAEENPEGALDAIGIRPGMVIADIGAGTGYFSIRMARRVGPTGKIYANDLQPEMLRLLRENADRARVTTRVFRAASDGAADAGSTEA